ncbi:hypothetical protein L1987_80490 [Smallanthus sonchifolius]|uniref:Uncharacterized protein n=1 Tax=Smallanthus sonchifolius TaxID=185202 RepID=A0ACB8YNW4_9ASTR|nr:hypothetical protein L1987_80490 [Smallanthus sonchifolius]
MLTLLQIQVNPNFNNEASGSCSSSSAPANLLVTSLGALCKAFKPKHVEVEGGVIQGGPKLETVVSQVKKLEVSVLVWVIRTRLQSFDG